MILTTYGAGSAAKGRVLGRRAHKGASLAKSSLILHRVNVNDSGNYTCQSLGATSKDSVNIHVLVDGIITFFVAKPCAP